MDFYDIKERPTKKSQIEIYPDFKVCRSKDLMIRGKSFYAIWDEQKQLWSTDEYDVQRLIDSELMDYAKKREEESTEEKFTIKTMSSYSAGRWADYRNYLSRLSDSSHQLDSKLVWQNTEIKKKDYVSKRLPYPLEAGSYNAWEEIIGTLYEETERAKLEWAIGSIVAGDAKDIQKFVVLYGEAGSGKSTILNIVQKLFDGYYTTFEAKALTSNNNTFSTEMFRGNPLVAIQHDGDLSKIEDNTKLNSIISHEEITMNEKYKPSYMARINCFLFMGTNKPVRITDAKSGIIRRLIDVRPSGKKIPTRRYQMLMAQTDFELGAIAAHCLEVYRKMGKNYYSGYRPLDMILQTDTFYNFVEANYYVFKQQDTISLSQAYEMYKVYCEEASLEFKLPRHKFREELKSYFNTFCDMSRMEGKQVRSVYSGFNLGKFASISAVEEEEHPSTLVLDSTVSIFDEMFPDLKAQYANSLETPTFKWANVETKLGEIDTTKLHYVKPPINHIVIDFDLKDETGAKSLEKNISSASKWPPTYAEFSKSGSGVHLHYFYDGDPEKLSRIFAEGIEIKVFSGDSSLRRKLSKCNTVPVAHINSGLPVKEEKLINFEGVKSEKALRTLILKNLAKEIHSGTKPSIDFIHKILEDAYSSGMKYDISDMRPKILAFANNSSHQSEYCVKLVSEMKFFSDEISDNIEVYDGGPIIFYDVEVYPNLFLISWKKQGPEHKCITMINPSAKDVEMLMTMKLIGFNCRRYDNHILYARYIGYDLKEIFDLSQKIIGGSRNALFGEAYNISYADVYDFSSIKQSLKKFQIDLGIHHQEIGLPWDKPVPEDRWGEVGKYCENDVISLEATFEDRKSDWSARQILADLSGLSLNDSTQSHAARIMFGNDQTPQDKFVYTDLGKLFPGYKFENGKSSYRGEDPGEGGYVYSETGMYSDVALLDVASMHPTSIEVLNLFGPYTARFNAIKAARIAVKHKDFESAKDMLDGKLNKYLTSNEDADGLAYALKVIIVSIYGFTSANFPNKFKDPRNVDNIVAKRGALFMIDLKHAVQEKGFIVAHIKTDSIKVPNATKEIIDFIFEFGRKYGYEFEHEATYKKFCLVNNAVYICKYQGGKHDGEWDATGAQFAQPYVFKTLFSKKPIEFKDMCETKAVSTALYLDFNENLGDEHNLQFIGKVGLFAPVKPGCGGGLLLREKEGKYNAAEGTKGYRWLEAEVIEKLGKEKDVNEDYYRRLVDQAVKDISKFGDFEWFVSD